MLSETYAYRFHTATADFGTVMSDDHRVPAVRIIFHPGAGDDGETVEHGQIFVDPDGLAQVIGELQRLNDQLAVMRGHGRAAHDATLNELFDL